jgi:nitrite reductase/ring-hydroxylating ferredoxin subunit
MIPKKWTPAFGKDHALQKKRTRRVLPPNLPELQPKQETSGFSQMTERPWHPLGGIRPDNTKYPTRASIEGEGIVIFKTTSGYRGVQRSCPHMGATMLNAELTANETMVRCPLHVFTFKLSDGKGVNCPGFKIRVYEIKEDSGAFYGRIAN